MYAPSSCYNLYCSYYIALEAQCISLVPRLPNPFNTAWEKMVNLSRAWHQVEPTLICHIIMIQQLVLAGSRNAFLTESLSSSIWTLQSASGCPSVPSLRVENCDLHGNSIVSTPRWNWLGRGHNRVTVQIAVFDKQQRDRRASTCWFIADCNVQIKELELSVRNASLEPANSLLYHNYMEVGSTWRYARGKFYQAPPLFSCNVEKIREPGDEATMYCVNIMHDVWSVRVL